MGCNRMGYANRQGVIRSMKLRLTIHRYPALLRCRCCAAVAPEPEARAWTLRYDDRPVRDIPYICRDCIRSGVDVSAIVAENWDGKQNV